MKYKVALMGTLLASSAAAFAQSNVAVYGIIDTGVEYLTHVGAAHDSLLRMPGLTGELPSRIGFRGTEDLGGGLKAVFVLENGFNVKNGVANQGTRLFGRQAFVGLQGGFGSLTFGRQYSMLSSTLDADLLGPTLYSGLLAFDNYLPNARIDNTIAYKGTFGAITAGATYSFGRDASPPGGTNSPGQGTCAGETAGNSSACRQWSAMIRYDAGNWGIATAYDEERGGSATAAANFFNGIAPVALANSSDKDSRMMLDGYAKFGALKLGGGWLGRRVRTVGPDVRADTYFMTAAYQLTGKFVLDGGVYRMINREEDTRGTITTIRGTYSFSKRTAVYAQTGYLMNSSNAQYTVGIGGPGATPAKGVNQQGIMVGIRHIF